MDDDPRREQERAVRSLLQALDNRDPSVRTEAALALGKIQDQYLLNRIIPRLKKSLYDPVVNVRVAVAWALGEAGNSNVLPDLYRALKEKEPAVRKEVAEALGKIESADAIPELCQALNDRDKTVRRAAAGALGQIKQRSTAIPYLTEAACDGKEDISVRRTAINSLGELGYIAAVPVLLDLLCDNKVTISNAAALALNDIQAFKKAPASFIDATKLSKLRITLRTHSDRDVLCTIARILGYVQDPATIPDLRRALYNNKDDMPVCEAVANALVRFGYDAERSMIDALLNGPTTTVRKVIASRLGLLETDNVVDALAQALTDPEGEVQHNAWAALKKINTPRSLSVRSQQPWIKKLLWFF
ncbi:MAG TPA: HEAT repeat domain-containing protein [Ktedonobacteraceae bacterium]|nr:HEAT repeat domain-containing protein [Ktedonobacteraceae bacterium]